MTIASQRSVVVLGMHRSGTSAITRGLQVLGVELGDRLIPGTRYNPTGHWENAGVVAINQRLMKALGIRWDSVSLVEPFQWESPTVQALRQEAVDTIHRCFAPYPLWGFKDPRTIRVLPFWQSVLRYLGVEDNYVVVVRHPLSITRSLVQRNALPSERAYLMWLVYMVPHLHRLRERPFVVVDYDNVMTNPIAQLTRIASVLHLPMDPHVEVEIRRYATEFLDHNLRHSHFPGEDLDRDSQLGLICCDAFRWLRRIAEDEVSPQSEAFWKDWQRMEGNLAALSPACRHMDEMFAHIAELNKRLAELDGCMAALRASRPSRITAALRALKRIVSRGTRDTKPRPK